MEPSYFCDRLCQLNRLDKLGFKRWVLEPGMGFRDRMTWWPPYARRQTPHEGIDFHFFEDQDGSLVPLPAASRVPPFHPGRVIGMFDDFLGTTIQLAHDIEINGCRLHSLYGHVVPPPGLQPRGTVQSNQTLATIAPTDGGRILPHLHLSIILVLPAYADKPMTWERINDPARAILCDPRQYLDLDGGTPEWQVYMVRCSDNTLYTGIAKGLAKRLEAHNSGRTGARYTRQRRPVHLVYSEPAASRSAAAKREYAIKQLPLAKKLALIDPKTR